MMQGSRKKRNLKICVIGSPGVGKTSVTTRRVKGKFSNQYRITVGADLFSYTLMLDDTEYHLQVWDTAGQERFQTIGTAFYRGSDACILVYDITSAKSFADIENWRLEFIKQGGVKDPQTFPFVLIGNKCDREAERTVDAGTAEEYCRDHGGMRHFYTSAKDDVNVNEAFLEVVRQAAEQFQEDEISHLPQIQVKPQEKKAAGGCC